MLIKFLLHGKEINLTGDNVIIKSNKFNVDKNGNMSCTNANILGGSLVVAGDASTSNLITEGNVGSWGTFRNAIYPHAVRIAQNRGSSSSPSWHLYAETGTEWANGRLRGFVTLTSEDNTANTFLNADQVVTPSVIQTSQEKDKKNFEKLQNALNIIKNIDIYKYNLKNENDKNKKHIGFVIGGNYNYSKEVTSNANEGVDVYSFVSVCCKAIQEQQEQIEQLQKEIKELKGDK